MQIFAAPWVLLGLLLLPLLPGRARFGPWLLRVVALALLLVALAQPSLPGRDAALSVLVDVSESVGDAAKDAAAPLVKETTFTFAGDTAALGGNSGQAEAPLEPERTDIGRALQVAAASGAGRLLLVSDGAESQGDALASLPDVPVDVLYAPSLGNVRLRELLAPARLSPGARAEITAVVESDRDTTLTLRPRVGGAELEPITRRVTAGQTPVRFTVSAAGTGGVLDIEASLELPFSQPLQDDSARAEIDVTQDEPVLVLGDPALARLLEAQGFRVARGGPEHIRAPLAYSAIVLREGAAAFSTGQLELLRAYVEEGGGLMMAGGPKSFGLGGWYRTPVETVLPVSTDVRSNVELPLVALVIIMDRSQSMSTGNPTKLELAKEGAIEVVDLAYERDQLGFLTFSDSEDWVFRLRTATAQGKREMLQAILEVQAGGGTILEPAYRAGLQSLRRSRASVKHIILLTDGRVSDGGGPFRGGSNDFDFRALARAGQRDGITTSSIAIGAEADTVRLSDIANAGGGRYYEAIDVSTLPRIFTSEALTATRSLLRNGPLPVRVQASPLTPAGLAPPQVGAYIATTLKNGSDLIFEGEDDEPVLAVSRQGLGRSAALTTDLNRFAGDFGRWGALPGVLGAVTRWLQVRPETYEVTATPDGDALHVVLDAVAGGEFINGETLTARYGGEAAQLEQVAPGRYEGQLPSVQAGGSLSVSRGDTVVARTQVNAPDSEFDTTGGQVLLHEIAARTGGQVIEDAASYAPELPRERSAVWMWFALAGLGVFVAELAVRRFGKY